MDNWVQTVCVLYKSVAIYAITWALARKVICSIIGAVTDGDLRF